MKQIVVIQRDIWLMLSYPNADDERERIPSFSSREIESPTTMLFSLEGGDADSYVIGKRAPGSRSDTNVDEFSGQCQWWSDTRDMSCIWFSVLWEANAVVQEEGLQCSQPHSPADKMVRELITETRCLVFDFLFHGEPVRLFKKTFAVFVSLSQSRSPA